MPIHEQPASLHDASRVAAADQVDVLTEQFRVDVVEGGALNWTGLVALVAAIEYQFLSLSEGEATRLVADSQIHLVLRVRVDDTVARADREHKEVIRRPVASFTRNEIGTRSHRRDAVMGRRVGQRHDHRRRDADAEAPVERQVLRLHKRADADRDRDFECGEHGEDPPNAPPPRAPARTEPIVRELAGGATCTYDHRPLIGRRDRTRETGSSEPVMGLTAGVCAGYFARRS